MAFTSRTAEMFSSYRYRDNSDMEVVSESSGIDTDSQQVDNDYDYDAEYDQETQTQTQSESETQSYIIENMNTNTNTNTKYPTTMGYNRLNQTHPQPQHQGYIRNKPVLHLREVCEDGSYDWSLFVRYELNDVYIVYGIRKSYSNDASNSSYNPIRFKFLGRDSLLSFFRHAFCCISSKLNVTMYNMEFDENTYEGNYQYYVNQMLDSKCNELFGYDGLDIDINMNTLDDYLTILRYAWN